jgi:hypothetical protein
VLKKGVQNASGPAAYVDYFAASEVIARRRNSEAEKPKNLRDKAQAATKSGLSSTALIPDVGIS